MAELLAANQITIAKVLDGEQGIPGEPGADGKTSYFHIKYSAVANPTSSSEMSDTPLAYIGTYVDFTEADSTDPTKYTWSRFEGIQGEKGEQGIPGIGTDGKTSYLHIAYATSADGSEGFSVTESANKTYIGQYTDFVSTDSTDYTKYSWTKIKGEMSAEQLAQLNQASEDASQAKSDVANLEIGGRNLFLNTGKTVSNNDYKISEYAPASWSLKAGEIYTATICVTPAENLSEIAVYFSLGYVAPARFSIFGTSKQVISETFTMAYYDGRTPDVNPSYAYAQLYRFPNDGTVTGNTTIHWFKLEKGNKATDWTPAPEDVDAGIDNAAKVATNFINYDSTNGLVLGNKESGSWVGYRTQIDTDSFNVLDENGNIIASYGSNEVELGKGNPNAIIKMCDGKAYVKNYIVGSQNTSVFCGQDVTVVGEWEGASEAYALFKQGFINIGQASSHIKFFNENGNMNQVEIQGQNITINGELALGTALSIANGGTGATTAAGARSNLGITKLTNAIKTRLPSNKSLTNAYSKCSLAQEIINGSLFTLSNNEITCGESGIVEVNLTLYCYNGFTANDLVGLACYKNGSLATRVNGRVNMAGAYQMFNKTDYIEVSKGDKLSLYAYNADGSRGVIAGETQMLVRYIA